MGGFFWGVHPDPEGTGLGSSARENIVARYLVEGVQVVRSHCDLISVEMDVRRLENSARQTPEANWICELTF